MAGEKYECTEVAVPSFGWPPGQTERTAMSHAFVDADGVRPGTRCQCGRAVVGEDGMPRDWSATGEG